jgi:hypothetical protein
MLTTKRIATVVLLCAPSAGQGILTATPALAYGAPGQCHFPPGFDISSQAGEPGANAGPNTTTAWKTAEGAPNAPGQAVRNVCIGK